MSETRTKPFNYSIGMFGTSIPINMLKTYAAIYYVDKLGMTTAQFALMLLIYTFIDAIDNPHLTRSPSTIQSILIHRLHYSRSRLSTLQNPNIQ